MRTFLRVPAGRVQQPIRLAVAGIVNGVKDRPFEQPDSKIAVQADLTGGGDQSSKSSLWREIHALENFFPEWKAVVEAARKSDRARTIQVHLGTANS